MRPMPITGRNFFNDLNPGIREGRGVGHFNDGDVQYAAMDASALMIIVRRTRGELFERFVARYSREEHLKVVINGNYYDVELDGKTDAYFGHDPVEALYSLPEGHVVSEGHLVDGSSRPNHFFVAREPINYPNPSDAYTFGQGDPPRESDAALGGLGPLIINRLKFGIGNLYHSGVPAGAPHTGEPGPRHRPFLAQRNNNTYVDFAAMGDRRGKVVLAIARAAQKILVLVQPEDTPTGISLDNLRDKLASVGVDDAVFMDGGNSALLVINNRFHVHMDDDKNELCTIGLGFK